MTTTRRIVLVGAVLAAGTASAFGSSAVGSAGAPATGVRLPADPTRDLAASCASGRAYGGTIDLVRVESGDRTSTVAPGRAEAAGAAELMLDGAIFSDLQGAHLAGPLPAGGASAGAAAASVAPVPTTAITFPVLDGDDVVVGAITVDAVGRGGYGPVYFERCSS